MGRPPREDGRKPHTVASNKYIKRNYERINLVVSKGEKRKIEDAAARTGESVSGFINRLIAAAVPGFVPLSSRSGTDADTGDGAER